MQDISRRQFFMVGTAATVAALGLAGCANSGKSSSAVISGEYKDGTFTGQSSTLDAKLDGDGYGIITITIEGGKIASVTFQPFQVDGTPKDEKYGKDGAFYAKAQNAVAAGDKYASALVEEGSLDKVDAISGATYMYDQFVEAAEKALKEAEE